MKKSATNSQRSAVSRIVVLDEGTAKSPHPQSYCILTFTRKY